MRAPALATTRPRSDWLTRVLHRKAPYFLVAVAGLCLHLTLARPMYAWHDRVGAWFPLAILLVLLYQHVREGRKSFPILLVAALQIYVFYSVPQFTQEALILYTGIYEPTPRAVSAAVWLVIAGELAFLVGYWIWVGFARNRPNLFDRILPLPDPRWARVLIPYAALSFLIFALISLRREFVPVSVRLPVSQLFNIYLALVLMLFVGYRFQLKRMRVAAFICIFLMSFVGIVQGSMGNIVNPVIILFVAAWIWAGKIRKGWLLAVLAGILIINPVKNQFRNLESGEGEVSSLARVGQRLGTWKLAFYHAWLENDSDANLLETASRTNDLLSVAQVVDYVPSIVPYNHGEGLAVTLVYWIPRLVWPSKPSSTDLLFNRYAVEFGYTTFEGTLTSTTGASTYTEGYWNFGVTGILIFLAIIGVLFGYFFGNNGLRGDVSTAICLVYYASVMLLIQPLSLTASSLVTFTGGVWVAMHGLNRLSGAQTNQAVGMRPLMFASPTAARRIERPR